MLDFSGGGFLVHIGTIKNINLFGHSSPVIFFFWRFSSFGDPPTYIIVFISHGWQKAGAKYRFLVIFSRVDVGLTFPVVVLLHICVL